MINWKDISELHVIKRLEQIIGEWFGVDLFYSDGHSRLQNGILGKDYSHNNQLLKSILSSGPGVELLKQKIENLSEEGLRNELFVKKFHCFHKSLQGFSANIVINKEFLGTAYAFPYITKDFSNEDREELIKLLQEFGVSEEMANDSVNELKVVTPEQIHYLEELIQLVSEEVITYHEEIAKREERILELNSEVGNKYKYHNIIGKSKKMQQIYALLEKMSHSESSVLIQGSNGTGKELVAKAIHYNSPRKDTLFLAQNCSAFNDNLLDSELFGHVKGAFTGAIKDKKGLFEIANGGTLFLDEIGDTSPTMQVKLLRVLQEGTFLPVGSTTPVKVDVRIITATNRDLKEMIEKGEFREDLFYRLNVINVNLPALKDRIEDIPFLVEAFLDNKCSEMGIPTKTLSKKSMEKLFNYAWPGNVRELQNEIERVVVLSGEDKVITPDILSPKILEGDGHFAGNKNLQGFNLEGSLKDATEELEYMMIKEGLKRCNFNKSKLAKELGISRAGLIMKVDKYGLDKRKKAVGE